MIKDRLGSLKAQSEKTEIVIQMPDGIDNPALEIEEPDDGHMDKFFSDVNHIRELIDRIQSNSDEIRKIHGTILSTTYTEDSVRQRLDELTLDIMKTAKTVRMNLKAMEQKIKEDEQTDKSSADIRMRKIQQSTMQKKFVDVMAEHSATQLDYRERCKGRIQRQLEITGQNMTDEELETALENGDPAIFTQGILAETQQAKQTLADLEARHADLIKLENSIRELHEAFMDMAMLVENQGEMIDRIEHNVTIAVDYVQTATSKTKQAFKYQGSARRKKLYVIICIVVVVAIALTLIIGFSVNWGQ